MSEPSPARALEDALAAVPFLTPIGITVAEVEAGRIGLRLPADKRTRDFSGYVSSGALFTACELAATLVLLTHPDLAGREPRRREAHIQYDHQTNRPVTVTASLPALPTGTDVEVSASAIAKNGDSICTLTATFSL